MTYKQTFWRTLAVVAAMLLTMPATVWADSTFGGGSGTQIDPYQIENPQHLRQLAADVNDGNSYEGKYFKMTSSFSCWIEPFTPIGGKYYTVGSGSNSSTGSRQFRGDFNGNGYTINDLYICPTEDFYGIGLFGELGAGAHVSNLTIASSQITTTIMGWGNCGAIAGTVNSDAIIYNCHVKEGVVVSVDPNDLAQNVQNSSDFGGIAGENFGIINQCTSMAKVTNADINGVNTLGGIVGLNGGKVWSCINLGSVIGSDKVGGIAGKNSGAYEFDDNYYHSIPAIGAVNGTDVEGATWMGTVSFSGGLSASVIATPTYSYKGVNYYKVGGTCSIGSDYRIDGGYIPVEPQFTSEQVEIDNNNSFTIPTGQDVVIDCAYSALKRDIAYTPWVSIDIPSQKYTGEPLTPVITVTDNMTGEPVVLSEGVDYSVTIPDGDMINAGDYAIQVNGIGDFAGTATASFVISPLRWLGEGTEVSPYQISTVDDWLLLAEATLNEENFTDTYFVLTRNLDFTGLEFKMVGGSESQYIFDGIFEANGNTIDNVALVTNKYAGLFGWLGNNAVVKNLTSGSGNVITSNRNVGGIAGRSDGAQIIACDNYATVTALYNSSAQSTSGKYAGGIVGSVYGGSIYGCRNYAVVNATSNAGGIVGYVASMIASVSDNLNFGLIGCDTYAGGITGNNSYGSHSNNYYAGDCNVGGINGSDAAGEAMRGYTISGGEEVRVELTENATVGVAYNEDVYAGAGQQVVLRLSAKQSEAQSAPSLRANAQTMFIASSGELTNNGDGTWTLIMPESGADVIISIDNDTVTGIEDIVTTTAKSGQRYNLMGQPVGKDYKGIVIEDGKKIIVR